MTTSTPTVPLLFLHVVADKTGVPAGFLFDAAAGEPAALAAQIGSDPFAALEGPLTRYYRGGLDPAIVTALQDAGWQELPPGKLLRHDSCLVSVTLPGDTALIEGDWVLAAPPKPTGAQAASRALALQLAQLVAADAPTQEIEALLRKDPTLSYHLLRLVNSLGMGVGRRITSFSQAILILGRQQLRRWVNLMLFAARQGDVRSAMLLTRVAVRGRLLEQLARARGHDKPTQDQAFIAGMFSLLGVLFGMPLPEILAPLSMSDAVQGALLQHKGELGAMLHVCEAFEQGDAGTLAQHLASLQIAPAQFNEALVEANHWMLGALDGATGAGNRG